jgi:rhomboid family GlyGly-CTERM serine protease
VGPLRRHAFFAALAVAAVVLFACGPRAFTALAYERAGVARGQVWRLATGPLVHAGAAHLVWNLAGLGLIWATLVRALPPWGWVAAATAAGIGSSAALFFLHPEVRAVTGLSAVLHGLLAAAAVAEVRRGRRIAWALLAVLALKGVWEQVMGAATGAMAGGAIAVDAHLYGALAGVLTGLALPPRRADG